MEAGTISATNEYAERGIIFTVLFFIAMVGYLLRKRFFKTKKEVLIEKERGYDDFFQKYI